MVMICDDDGPDPDLHHHHHHLHLLLPQHRHHLNHLHLHHHHHHHHHHYHIILIIVIVVMLIIIIIIIITTTVVMTILVMTSWILRMVVAHGMTTKYYGSRLPCAKRLCDMTSSRRGSRVVCYCLVRKIEYQVVPEAWSRDVASVAGQS